MQEEGLKVMELKKGSKGEIKYRYISRWFLISSSVTGTEKMFVDIEKLNPDAVVIDLDLYDWVGGIDALNLIRDQLDVNTWFE